MRSSVLARDTLKVAVGRRHRRRRRSARLLDRVFGALPANGDARAGARRAGAAAAAGASWSHLDVPQAVVRFGGAGIARNDPDFIPAYVVNHILGGGSFTSRLYDEVREKRGLAYGVYS